MSKKQISTNGAPQAIGPYSQAIQADDLLFASGQIPINPETGEVVAGGIEEQAKQVFKNINAVLDAAGLGFSNIVKMTVFIKDLEDFAKLNGIYAEYFEQPYPARSCVEVSRLPKDVLVEIELVAKA